MCKNSDAPTFYECTCNTNHPSLAQNSCGKALESELKREGVLMSISEYPRYLFWDLDSEVWVPRNPNTSVWHQVKTCTNMGQSELARDWLNIRGIRILSYLGTTVLIDTEEMRTHDHVTLTCFELCCEQCDENLYEWCFIAWWILMCTAHKLHLAFAMSHKLHTSTLICECPCYCEQSVVRHSVGRLHESSWTCDILLAQLPAYPCNVLKSDVRLVMCSLSIMMHLIVFSY